MQMNDVFQGFLDDCFRAGRKWHTVVCHKNAINKVLRGTIGHIVIEKFRLPDVSLVIERGKELGTSVPTSSVITLRRVLRYAEGMGYKVGCNWRDIEVPHAKVKSDVQALDKDEIKHLRKFLDENIELEGKHCSKEIKLAHRYTIIRTRCLLEFLLHTGLRISEALAVNIEDLDLEKCELRVRNIKSETWDTVYLYGCVDHINEYLKFRQDENPALFLSNTGVRLPVDTAKSTLRRLKTKYVSKKTLSHKLFRSTFVTTLFRARRDPKEVQLLARHRSLQTTLDYYYKVEKEKLKPVHKAVMEFL
jgi:integrase